MRAKCNELHDYYNSLLEKPQVLLKKINELSGNK